MPHDSTIQNVFQKLVTAETQNKIITLINHHN